MTPLEKAEAKKALMREKGIEMIPRTRVEIMLDAPTINRAVRVFCWQCNGYISTGGKNCAVKECPLWLFRAGSTKAKAEEVELFRKAFRHDMQAVKEYSPDHHRAAMAAIEAAKALGIDADAEGDEETIGETPEETQK